MNKIFCYPIFSGLYMILGNNSVVCTVSQSGQIYLKTNRNAEKLFWHPSLFFVRGIEFVILSAVAFFRGLQQSFESINQKVDFSNQGSASKANIFVKIIVIFVACLFGFFGVFVLSNLIGFAIFSNSNSVFVKNLSIAIVRVVLLYFVFWGLSLVPILKPLWRFNQAGNQIVTGKQHRWLNFINILISSLLGSIFVITLIGLNLSVGAKILVNLAIILIFFGLFFEIALYFENNEKGCGLVAFFGVLSTASPSKTEHQVALSAYNEILLMEENKDRQMITTTQENTVNFAGVYGEVKNQMTKAGITDPSEADWLIASVLKCKRLDIKLLHTISPYQEKEIFKALHRRIKGEPLAKIFEYTEFYGLSFKVTKDVLTPRQETEILVEQTIMTIGNKPLKILDLCTGSGAIAVAIAKNTKAEVTAVDISEKALEIAKQNAETNNVKVAFRQSDLFQNLRRKKFDIIVSNPPYIKTSDIQKLDVEVKNFDPLLALDGGESGYEFYQKIIAEAPKYLANNGKILLEVGKGQASKVKKLLTESFSNSKIIKDYNNISRVVIAERKKK